RLEPALHIVGQSRTCQIVPRGCARWLSAVDAPRRGSLLSSPCGFLRRRDRGRHRGSQVGAKGHRAARELLDAGGAGMGIVPVRSTCRRGGGDRPRALLGCKGCAFVCASRDDLPCGRQDRGRGELSTDGCRHQSISRWLPRPSLTPNGAFDAELRRVGAGSFEKLPADEHQCLAVVGSVHAGWPWTSVTSAHADSIICAASLGIGTYCSSSANFSPARYDQSKNLSISIAVSRLCCCL